MEWQGEQHFLQKHDGLYMIITFLGTGSHTCFSKPLEEVWFAFIEITFSVAMFLFPPSDTFLLLFHKMAKTPD